MGGKVGQVLSAGARQGKARGSLVHCSGVWELASLAEGLADMLAGRGGQQELAPPPSLRCLCALLLSMGFHCFIAGRIPVLRQLFQQEPCSASLPAFAMGHVPLPLTWGVKQSSCVKARKGTARVKAVSKGRHGCSLLSSLVCSLFPRELEGWPQLRLFARLKHGQQGLMV